MLIKRSLLALIGITLLFSIILLFIADIKLKASILAIAQSKAELRTVELINRTVTEKIVAETEYKDIIYIHKDDKGRIVMIQANTIILNQIMARTIGEVAKTLDKLDEDIITIPLGAITGSKLLSGYGPRFKVKMIPASRVNVEMENKFEQAGINQTRHLVYFRIRSKIRVAVPFINKGVDVVTTVPLAETIIVGDVPDTYVDFKGMGTSFYPLTSNSVDE